MRTLIKGIIDAVGQLREAMHHRLQSINEITNAIRNVNDGLAEVSNQTETVNQSQMSLQKRAGMLLNMVGQFKT